MLHRTKKINDINHDKWIGVGGKFEDAESPFDCVRREIKEETGLTPISLNYSGIVTFISNIYETEYMHLFKCTDFDGSLVDECNEGELVWINKADIPDLPIWEGDKLFLKLLDSETEFFSLKLVYNGDKLISHTLEY